MRVTNQMMSDFARLTITQNRDRFFQSQVQAATGNRINRPSDDPMGMRKILENREHLIRIAQYKENITHGKNRIETMETVLATVQDLITEAKEITLDNTTGDTAARQLAVTEIEYEFQQIMGLANTRYGDTYLFSGHKLDTIPFSRDADPLDPDDDYDAVYHGDRGETRVKTGANSRISMTANGADIFTGDARPDGVNIFNALKDAMAALSADPYVPAQVDNPVDRLDESIEQVQRIRRELSMQYRQLETADGNLDAVDQVITAHLADIRNADLAEVVLELQAHKLAYEAGLSVTGDIFDTNLMKFLS